MEKKKLNKKSLATSQILVKYRTGQWIKNPCIIIGQLLYYVHRIFASPTTKKEKTYKYIYSYNIHVRSSHTGQYMEYY